MIDYETYCKIKDCHERQRLTIAQTARALGLDARTVAKWAKCSHYRARRNTPRSSRLDPFKDRVLLLLEGFPYSAQQIYRRLCEEGFDGGLTIVKDYVHSGMSRAIIHSSDYPSIDAAKGAINRHFEERNNHFQKNHQRAGRKIWGKEREPATFSDSSNCKDPRYR